MRITPLILDTLINGRKVYINRREDGSIYATDADFTGFGVKPLKIVRVPLDYYDPPAHPKVLKVLKRERKREIRG